MHLDCIFCQIPKDRIVFENDLIYAIFDGFPVTKYHSLIIPKRHIKDFFDLSEDELLSANKILHQMKEHILAIDESVTGFNIGMNAGESAGQTVFHCHIHLIPRRDGDVENPRGGVRHTIPGKGSY